MEGLQFCVAFHEELHLCDWNCSCQVCLKSTTIYDNFIFFQEIDNWLGKNERTAIVPMFLPFLKKIILHISMVVPRVCGGGFLPVFCAHVIVLCSSSVVVWPYFHTFLFKFITQTSSGRNHGGIPFLHVKVDQLEGKIL